MRGNPFVGTARIGWMEFWSHLKSPRLIIMVVLLSLLMFGVAYGMTQTSSPGYYSYLNISVYPAIRNESGTNHYLAVAWLADDRGVPKTGASVEVYRQDWNNPGNGTGTYLTTLQTDSSGFVTYEVGTTFPENVSYALKSGDNTLGSASFGTPQYPPWPLNATFQTGRFSYGMSTGPLGTQSSYSFQVMTMEGYPASAASVYLDGNLTGHPDANGYFSGHLTSGSHVLNVTYQGYSQNYPLQAMPSTGPQYTNGADAVLIGLVGSFMGLVLPIMAIAVSFDAIAREKAQGSLEILLARRVRREGVLMGKFLGAFAAVVLPVTVVLLAGVAVVTSVSGRAPTTTFALAVFGASFFLIAVYVLLMLLFSSLAKNVGTAVVFGVVTWLFFNLIFSFITTFLILSSGGYYFSSGFYTTLLTTYLFDPNTLFQLILGAAVPTTGGGGGFFGIVNPTGYLATEVIALAAVLWVLIPLALTVLVFRKKAES